MGPKDQDQTTQSPKTNATPSGIPGVSNRIAVLTSENKAFRLHKDRVVLGSVVSADVRLTGSGVAPIHAVLELATDSKTAKIYDLASDTGVFVNGVKAITRELRAGDEIKIGSHVLKFFIEDIAEATRAQPNVRDSGGRKLFVNNGEDMGSLLLVDESLVEEIFDYRPTTSSALEVVMSWSETILDVEHFVTQTEVTIGNQRKSDFAIPPLLGSVSHALVTRSGDHFALNLDPKMTGVIHRKGALTSLQEACAGARQSPDGYQITIERSDFAKISLGEIDFYVSFTAAPPRLKRARLLERDPFLWKVIFSSLALTAASVTGMMNLHVPQSIEAEQLPDRIATILYQPERYSVPRPKIKSVQDQAHPSEPEKTAKTAKSKPEITKVDLKPNPANADKKIPTEMDVGKQQSTVSKQASGPSNARAQNKAKEGQGARAKGKEGKRGDPKAGPGATAQNKAMRPSPQGGPGAGDGKSQVPDIGNVDFLKGASNKIQNLLGNSAANLGKGGERLQGFGGFNTRGNGGLALSGDGKGGGGTADSLGGLSDKGRGGGRVGTGLGAAGDGTGIIGGKSRVVIRTGGSEEAVVMGSIDASAIEAALLAHRDEFRLCYEREINAETPDLAGRVGTSFVIGSSGRVTQAGIASTTLKNVNTERCILAVIKRIDFPVPRGGGLVQVTYPFKFSSTGK